MRDIIFYTHITFLCTAVVGIFLADKAAFAWLRGTRETVHHRAVLISHRVVTIGLVGLILSGLTLFWSSRDFLMGETIFWVKMFFVAALVVNSFFIKHLMHIAVKKPWRSLTVSQKIPLIISGGISTLSWLGAGTAAFFLFG